MAQYEVQRSKGNIKFRLGKPFDSRRAAISYAMAEIDREAREGEKKVTIWVRDMDNKEPRVAHFRINERGIVEREIRK